MARIELKIAKPCNQTWTAMKGDDKVRFCASCQKNVYNIGQMSDDEVEALIRRTEGKFCARIYKRTDNRVMTADCPKGVAAARRKIVATFTAFGGALATVFYPAFMMPTMGVVETPKKIAMERAKRMQAALEAEKVEAHEGSHFMGYVSSRSIKPKKK